MSKNSRDIIPRGLHVYTLKQLEEGFARQKKIYGWDFNDERQFIEDLFCQRFNFLLIIYSLFITAAASTASQTNLSLVLWLGTALSLLVTLTIWRAYAKLIINLTILHNLPKHAFEYINNEINAWGFKGLFGVNAIIGIWVPWFCSLSLLLGAILASCGIIKVPPN